jgi:hypothetical protein
VPFHTEKVNLTVDRPREPCPDWCALPHTSAATSGHEGVSSRVHLSRPSEEPPQSLSIRTVQYLPLEWEDGASWRPFVEVAIHTGDRYRMINVTSTEARRLAAILLVCAREADDAPANRGEGGAPAV